MHSPGDQEFPIAPPARRKRSFLRTILISFLVFLLLLAGAAYFAQQSILRWSATPQVLLSPIELELSKGESLLELSKELEARGLVTHWRLFQLWTRFYGDYSRFQAGPYRFENSASPQEIAGMMTRGETYNPVVFQIAVPEGATLQQISAHLAEAGLGTQAEILEKAHDLEFLKKLKLPSTSLEGFLYPATYPFSEMPRPEDVFTVMVEQFWKSLPADYEKQISTRNLNLLQAVTFASLIELETASDEERPYVSEVIWNRLKLNVALGIDAAIIYGIPDYHGDITWKHLHDEKNPYNLRLHTGLPPSPIASPSLKSLLAVLNPSNLGYLYYVVDPDVPGRHNFAKTIAEHNRNVRKYLAAQKKR